MRVHRHFWLPKTGKQLEKANILIIKVSAIGDTVIAMPHIDAICAYHSQDTIRLLTGPPSRSIFANHSRLNLAVLDRNKWFGRDSFWSRLFWIRRQKFARVYDLQGNRISRLLTRLSGCSFRVGSSPHPVYTHAPVHKWVRTTHQNVFDRLNETLMSAGLPAAEKQSFVRLDNNDISRVSLWIRQHGLEGKKYAVFHAGSSSDRPAKRWPVDNYLKLAEMIESKGIRCIWVGAEPEKEINAFLSERVGIDSTGEFTLRQLYEFARKAFFGVSSDSCPMHIFAAAGIPVYSFFGPENWRWSYPLGQRDRVLTKGVECSPCFRGSCPDDKGHQCLDGITPEWVFHKIDQELHLLKNRRSDLDDA